MRPWTIWLTLLSPFFVFGCLNDYDGHNRKEKGYLSTTAFKVSR